MSLSFRIARTGRVYKDYSPKTRTVPRGFRHGEEVRVAILIAVNMVYLE